MFVCSSHGLESFGGIVEEIWSCGVIVMVAEKLSSDVTALVVASVDVGVVAGPLDAFVGSLSESDVVRHSSRVSLESGLLG